MSSRLPRLPADRYLGRIAVAFTACLEPRKQFFTSEEAVAPHREVLLEEVEAGGCIAYAYCFMPDHFHLLLLGTRSDSQPLNVMKRFKQRSGFRLRTTTALWQSRFYDHVLRQGEDTIRQAIYVLYNPVRAGLVSDPFEYPFNGTIGISIDDLLVSVIDL